MRKILSLIIFVNFSLFAQSDFIEGYFINNKGNKVNCYIKNEDSFNIPKSFKYKITDSSDENTVDSSEINFLFISPNIKYERHIVDIDFSSDQNRELSKNRKSDFKKESLLLKVILEGELKLLEYSNAKVTRFFILNNEKLTSLEYKKFLITNKNISENKNYQLQLRELFECDNLDYDVRYTRKEFINFFKNYANCKNIFLNDLTLRSKKKGVFNVRAKLGSIYTSLDKSPNDNKDFNSGVVFKIGLEFEYIFGLNNNRKWSVFTDPSFQTNYNTSNRYLIRMESIGFGGSGNPDILEPVYGYNEINYSAIELPFGLRHYMYLKNKKSIYFSIAMQFSLPVNSNLKTSNEDTLEVTRTEITTTIFGANFGLGYKINDKFNLDLIYTVNDYLTKEEIIGRTEYPRISQIGIKAGYNIF